MSNWEPDQLRRPPQVAHSHSPAYANPPQNYVLPIALAVLSFP
jgi:hypothetical protein